MTRNQQEKDMSNNSDNTRRPDVQDNTIELGVASVETKGVLAGKEIIGDGTPMFTGISEE